MNKVEMPSFCTVTLVVLPQLLSVKMLMNHKICSGHTTGVKSRMPLSLLQDSGCKRPLSFEQSRCKRRVLGARTSLFTDRTCNVLSSLQITLHNPSSVGKWHHNMYRKWDIIIYRNGWITKRHTKLAT